MELAFKILEMAKATGNYQLFSESLLPWLDKRWQFIWERQRFLLSNSLRHKAAIETALNLNDDRGNVKIAVLLSAILPKLGISNQKELEQVLSSLPR